MIGKTISHYVLEKVLSPRRENAHLRSVVTEAAWAYRDRPAVGGVLRKRQDFLAERFAKGIVVTQKLRGLNYRHGNECPC